MGAAQNIRYHQTTVLYARTGVRINNRRTTKYNKRGVATPNELLRLTDQPRGGGEAGRSGPDHACDP